MAQETSDPAVANPKAAQLQTEAENLAKKFDWFGMNREQNQEQAAETFIKAGSQWKLTKHFQRAGDCFKRAAECLMAVGNQVEANSQWKEAGKCYRHFDSTLAIDAYKNAIQYFLDEGKFNQAARLHEEIAEMLNEDGSYPESIQQYEKAIEFYESEHDETSANKRILIVAHMYGKIKQYDQAVQLFEKAARFNADNNLLRWNVKTILFKAMLCQLNNAAEHNDSKLWNQMPAVLEKYRDSSDLFGQSREYMLCASLVDTVPACELEKYKTAVTQYDNIVHLEPWATDQVVRLEEYINRKSHEAPILDAEPNGPDLSGEVTSKALNTGVGAKPSEFEEKDGTDLANAPNLLDEN